MQALFTNLRRHDKNPEMQRSVSEYFRICDYNRSLISKRSSQAEEETRKFGGRRTSVGREESEDDSDND